jgi:hypothetical protein
VGKSQLLVVQDGPYVLQNLLRLGPDIAGHEVAGLWNDGNLPGAKKQVSYSDGMIVRADGGWGLGRLDDNFVWHVIGKRLV